jgi:anthranilate synthase component 1
VEGGEQLARYSFIGRDPYQVLSFKEGNLTLEHDGKSESLSGDFYDRLDELVSQYQEPKLPELPRLTGGAVGYVAYDTIRQTEYLPDIPEDDLKLPDAIWAFYNEIYAFDHVRHRIILIRTVFIDGTGADLDALFDQALEGLDRMQDRLNQDIQQYDARTVHGDR